MNAEHYKPVVQRQVSFDYEGKTTHLHLEMMSLNFKCLIFKSYFTQLKMIKVRAATALSCLSCVCKLKMSQLIALPVNFKIANNLLSSIYIVRNYA